MIFQPDPLNWLFGAGIGTNVGAAIACAAAGYGWSRTKYWPLHQIHRHLEALTRSHREIHRKHIELQASHEQLHAKLDQINRKITPDD